MGNTPGIRAPVIPAAAGDGFSGSTEDHVYSNAGPRDQDPCGGSGWPADLVPGGIEPNKVNLQDMSSFVAPLPRKLDTDPGDAGYNVRWDLVPGNGAAAPKDIILTDISILIVVKPPMLLTNVRAFGATCPWPQ